MIKKDIKELKKYIRISGVSGISINFGFIGLSVSGSSSKANML